MGTGYSTPPGYSGKPSSPRKSAPKKSDGGDNKISIKVKASGPVAKQVAPMARKVAQTIAGGKTK
jgi:hypothetical protein